MQIRLAAIKSKDGSQQYKNENTVFWVFCVNLLSRELPKSHHFEFPALVYDAFFQLGLRSRNVTFLGTYQVQTDPLFCNAIIAYDPAQYCVFGFVWIWWIESNGDDLLPTTLTTDNFGEHSRMRYFYHDFWKKAYFLLSWKGIIINFLCWRKSSFMNHLR